MSTAESPGPTHRRLAKTGDGSKRFHRDKGKAPARAATIRTPTPTESTPAPAPQPRKHTCCDNPNPTIDDEGQLVCTNCFTQIAESNIVAEVTFSEDARGAATIQGGFLGENARHVSTMGQGAGHVPGGTQKSSEQISASKGKQQLDWLAPRLALKQPEINRVLMLYGIATKANFSAGRRTDEVIGACLYAVCRQQANNTVMLMDISELLRLNVFRLGEVYKDLCKDLYLEHDPEKHATGTQQMLDIESVVMKFCRKLEFGAALQKVGSDAIKIIQRMKRDWMVTGRNPAGLCGAAIILAARMNNFRRSVREVVWVVKVTDLTVLKRVMEFRRSKATTLTVDDFRAFGPRLKDSNDPPVLYESKVQKMKFEAKKRKRQEASEARDRGEVPNEGQGGSSNEHSLGADDTLEDQDSEPDDRRKRRRTTDNESATDAPTQQEPRRDAEGFVIPALPASRTQPDEEQDDSRKRGRKKKDALPPLVISEEELITEENLQQEIQYVIKESDMQQAATELEISKAGEYAAKISLEQKTDDADQAKSRRQAENVTWVAETPRNEEVTAEELEVEFENDPEVQNCLLSEDEQNAKERIWIFNNEDWLRQQQEKKMMETVAKAAGRNEKGKKASKTTKRKKKGKIGDGSLLKNTDTPIETPADATGVMLRERTPQISNFIDQAALNALFRRSPSSTSGSSSAPNAGISSDQPTPKEPNSEPVQESELSLSSTPAPTSEAGRMPSPPISQQVRQADTVPESPERRRTAAPPATPPETQTQAAGGAEVAESEGDEDDYLQDDELDYGSDHDVQEGGDDEDFERTLSPTNRWAVDDDAYGNDDYDQ